MRVIGSPPHHFRRMAKMVIPSLLLTVSACTTDQQGVRVEQVPVPTPIACVDNAQVPAEPARVGDKLNGDAVHDLGVVAPNALELRIWGETLYALIVPGCTKL